MQLTVVLCFQLMVSALAIAATPTFKVRFDAAVRGEPATGRLIVMLVKSDSKVSKRDPLDGPFWEDPQPMYGVDVAGLAPGSDAVVDAGATSFPVPLSELPQGSYIAQAVLIVNRASSSWRSDAGNLWSDPVPFKVGESPVDVSLALTHTTVEPAVPLLPGVDKVQVRSALLSEFHGREIMLTCGVIVPRNLDATRRYAAVYDVSGFGGTWHRTFSRSHPWITDAGQTPDMMALRANTFWIGLDCESPNGPTMFADSANNGPWGRALIEELIPALEKRYPLITAQSARLLQGHSTGGWSTLWLALTYPETFGATWSSSPDPVDFRRMQLVDIYAGGNMYAPAPGDDSTKQWIERGYPSFRQTGRELMTIRQENLMEEVLGPGNTSGQQWDSWYAIFGPRTEAGHPAALFDPATGAIDPKIAEEYRPFDIGARLQADAGVIGPLLHQRVRLYVGDRDNFFLNEAVALLKAKSDALSFLVYPEGKHGVIAILKGYDHGTIMASPEHRAIPKDMLAHLRRAGYVQAE